MTNAEMIERLETMLIWLPEARTRATRDVIAALRQQEDVAALLLAAKDWRIKELEAVIATDETEFARLWKMIEEMKEDCAMKGGCFTAGAIRRYQERKALEAPCPTKK